METIHCKHCGTPNSGVSNYCHKCGKPLMEMLSVEDAQTSENAGNLQISTPGNKDESQTQKSKWLNKPQTEEEKKTAKGCLWIMGIAIIIGFFILNKRNDEENNSSKNSIPFTIIDHKERLGTVVSIYTANIRIEKKITEEELKSLAIYLKTQINTKAHNIRYFFYLPGMLIGNGAWATSVFNPDLAISIMGSSKEEDQIIQTYVNNCSGEYLGHWTDYHDKRHIVYGIKKENGKFILDGYSSRDHSSGVMSELTLKKRGALTIYVREVNQEEYYIINARGDLDAYDEQGYIVTYQKVN